MDHEGLINYLVVLNKPGRRFTSAPDSRWGGTLTPDPAENPGKTDAGVRVVLFASWEFGYLVLETLKAYEAAYPGQLNLAGLVTDDPLHPKAKISLKKRVWNLLDMPSRVIDETFIIESGLSHGIPVHTGEVKTESFHALLTAWKPDAILVCVFGQIIDAFTIQMPRYGIYNFHPSDLSLHQGAGPAPYDDLAARQAATTVWSVHHVSEQIDAGRVVGQSPPIRVLDAQGALPADPLVVYHKLAEALSPLAFFLARELARRHGSGALDRIDHLDFGRVFPDALTNRLMQPIAGDPWSDVLSIPEGFLYEPGQDQPVRQVGADARDANR